MLKSLFIGCGGAGSNIVESIQQELSGLEYCDFVTVDTSAANAKKDIEFIHLKKDSHSDELLAGSGGIRGKNLADVKKGVEAFINNKKLYDFKGVIYLVFSTNGGSGNIIAALMLKELLHRDISICCLMVHDTTSKQYAEQSLDTIKSLYGIATDCNKALVTIYYLNDKLNVTKVNEIIRKEIKTIIEFNDIENIVDIDAEDMRNFYKPTIYSKLNIAPGIYGISALEYGNVEAIIKNYDVLISRTLTSSDIDPMTDAGILQYKKGTNHKYDSESMLLLINNFEKHYTLLQTACDSYTNQVKMFKIEVDRNSDGLVL